MNLENPLVSLEWSDYTTLPIGMQHVQAVVVGDKVYVGGGMTTDPKADTNIYVFDHTIESPRVTSIPTPGPTRWSTLATIHSRLVLAGGAKPHNATNELWALNDDGCTWDSQAFPTMPKSCWGASAVSTGDYLILAGGVELHATKPLDTVQIYNAKSKLWGLAESLPTSCYFMKNTLLEGNWYLGGGRWQFGEVVYAELDALIQSVAADQRRPSEREDLVWKKLPEPELSGRCSSICAHRDQLLTIGGTELSTGPTRKIRMYSTVEKSWKMVGKMPKAYDSACTIVLPNAKDILLIGGNDGFLPSYTDSVTKGCLKVVRSLDEQISLGALEHIQIVGETKGTDIFHTLASTNMGIGIVADKGTTAKPVLEWMARNSGNQAPTWKVLLEVFRIIKMKEVADKIEEFIKAVPEHHTSTHIHTPWKPQLALTANVRSSHLELDLNHDLVDVSSYLLPLRTEDIFRLGLVLGLSLSTLQPLMESPTFLQGMLIAWLQGKDEVGKKGGHTWRALVDGLRHPLLKQTQIAETIERERCS